MVLSPQTNAAASTPASTAVPTHGPCVLLAARPPTISFEAAPLKAQLSLESDFLCFPDPQREAYSPWSTSVELVPLKQHLGAGLGDYQLFGDKHCESGNSHIQGKQVCGSRESHATLSRLTQGLFHVTTIFLSAQLRPLLTLGSTTSYL